jgi:hypothetical protein
MAATIPQKIQHCPISSKFDMWVDYDVPNWFLTLKNFYRSPFSKWPPQYCTNSTLKMATARNFSMSGINSAHHNLPTYEISLKSNSWICAVLWWPFWKWRPVEIFQCQVWNRDIIIYPHMKCRWNRTMLNLCSIVVAFILDIEKFLAVAIFKMATQIQHCPISSKFDM